MKNFLITLVLLTAVVFGAVLLYNKFRKPSSTNVISNNQTAQQSAQQAEFNQKKAQFDNSIKEMVKTDADVDGLTDTQEKQYGTDPNSADTDADGLLDKDEINIYHADPLKADTDGDGYSDGYEVRHHTNPLDPNSHP